MIFEYHFKHDKILFFWSLKRKTGEKKRRKRMEKSLPAAVKVKRKKIRTFL